MPAKKHPFSLLDEKTEEIFIGLCELQCTMVEVCGFFRISKTILRSRIKEAYGQEATYETVFEQFSSGGRVSLRRNQFRLAQKSAAMAIFLGKNYLDQVDVKTLDDVNKPITLVWKDADKQTTEKVEVPASKGSEAEQ